MNRKETSKNRAGWERSPVRRQRSTLDCCAIEKEGGGGEINSKHPLNPENKATGINWFNSSLFAQHSKPSLRNLKRLSHARAQGLFNNLQDSMKELLFSVNPKMCTE